MAGSATPNGALTKLFNLDFYKKQEHWKLASKSKETSHAESKSDMADSTLHSPAQNIDEINLPMENKQTKPDLSFNIPTIIVSSSVENNAVTAAQNVKCSDRVAKRLNKLFSYYHECDITRNSDTIDCDLNWESLPMHTQEDVFAEGLEINRFKEDFSEDVEFPQTLLREWQDSGVEPPEAAEGLHDDWAWLYEMDNTQMERQDRSQTETPHLRRLSDEGSESFMRHIHDVPHSTDEDLGFPNTDELNPNRLAELSPRQLRDGIAHHAQQLHKLRQEASLRTVTRSFDSTSRIAVPEEQILAGSFHSPPQPIASTSRGRGRLLQPLPRFTK